MRGAAQQQCMSHSNAVGGECLVLRTKLVVVQHALYQVPDVYSEQRWVYRCRFPIILCYRHRTFPQ